MTIMQYYINIKKHAFIKCFEEANLMYDVTVN
jgi:hypothetical protein